MSPSAYANWSKDDLIARIQSLEATLTSASSKISPERIPKPVHFPEPAASHKKPKKEPKPFDINAYPKRKIALKFCYSGWEYNGLAFQNEPTPLPMVEAVLLRALGDCRLIDPSQGLEGCGWSRCGRTDRGVSAAGQVVSLNVRSAIGSQSIARRPKTIELPSDDVEPAPSNALPAAVEPPPPTTQEPELRYVNMLNSVLPRSIRALAWSPVSEDFDARFSCSYRHYKYFFTPGIPPHPWLSHLEGGMLDIAAMRTAAARLVGEHDFRNFCKVDPSKQVENYNRRILEATISPVDSFGTPSISDTPPLYVFDLRGTAFLYHQVRHIMAILFLVGARLEPPEIVDTLLDAEKVPRKPVYEMADGLPLVLWDCGYPEGAVNWRVDDATSTNPESSSNSRPANGRTLAASNHNIFYDFDLMGTQNLIKMTMTNHFAKAASLFHQPPAPPSENTVFRRPLGGGLFLQSARSKYIKLMERPTGELPSELNERWRVGAGARRKEKREAKAAVATDDITAVSEPAEPC